MNVENIVAMAATNTKAPRTIRKMNGVDWVNGLGGSEELAAADVADVDWFEEEAEEAEGEAEPEIDIDTVDEEAGAGVDDMSLAVEEESSEVGVDVIELSVIEGLELTLMTCDVTLSNTDCGDGVLVTCI